MNHFTLLVWKNFRLKLHHWIITILELLLPIGITALILKYVTSSQKPRVEIQETPSRPAYDFSIASLEFYYSPASPITSSFMKRLQQIDKYSKINPLFNETELERYLLDSGIDKPYVIGVHFRNLQSSKSMPYKFSYILRQVIADQLYNNYFINAQLLLNQNFIEYINLENPQKIEEIGKIFKEMHFQIFPMIIKSERLEVTIPIFIICLVIFIFSISFMADILEEKNSGIKELIKITGVNELTIWLTWFLYALSGILVSITVCTALLNFYPRNDLGQTAYKYVPFVILWLFLVLYCLANTSFCFVLSSIFQNHTIVTITFSLYTILIFAVRMFLSAQILEYVPLYVLCFSPLYAFFIGCEEILIIENKDITFNWSIFTHSQVKDFEVPFGLLFIFCILIFDALLYLFLAYYITNINPGKFGTRKSPFFLFEGLFLKNSDVEDQSISTLENELNPKYFEPPPSNLEASLQIVNLHKHFKSFHAVRGVNLVTYEGEITALLGHNGAGKTTTMSILTGLNTPSSGSVFYKGLDVFKYMDEFRLHIGLCPQEDRTIPYLSVMDHLLFFGQLKGASKAEAKTEAEEYLSMIDMESKKNSKAHELSGGMKRKLCLSIAMMGKAEVLILDEPSSGMDTESRRGLWNLLLELREGRSIILTTHHMDEADALGDRIAIMNHGVIVCHGTSLFLKKAYDTGYELTITKTNDNSADITQLVQRALPSASVVSDTRREIVFKLPLTDTYQFPGLFLSLESAVTHLGIQEIGVTATTMEQVFLLAGDSPAAFDPNSPKIIEHADYPKNTGLSLAIQQLWAIFKKKFLFTTRDLTNLFLRLVLPTFILCLILRLAQESSLTKPDQPVDVSLSTFPGGKVIYEEIEPTLSLAKQVEKFVAESHGVFIKGNGSGIETVIYSLASEHIEKYDKNLVSGIDVSRTRTKLYYSIIDRSLSITVDVFSNVLLREKTNTDQYSIETTSHPLASKNPKSFGPGCVKSTAGIIQNILSIVTLGFFTADLLVYFWHFVSMERIDGFYHIQMMSNLHPFVYWLGTLLFDFMLFATAMIIRMVLFKLLNSMDVIGFHEDFFVFLLILTFYGISTLLWIYVLTFLINLRNISMFFFLIINITILGFATFHWYLSIYFTMDSEKNFIWYIIYVGWLLIYTIPTFTFYTMIGNLLHIFASNSQCSNCAESYKPLCETELKKVSYWEFPSVDNPRAMLSLMVISWAQIVVYSLILYLFYSGFLGIFFNEIKKSIFGTESTQADTADDDVQQERDQVQQLNNLVLTSDDYYESEEDWIEEEFRNEEDFEAEYFSVSNQLPKSRLRRKMKMDYEHYGYEQDYVYIDEDTPRISLLVDGLRKNYISWFKNVTAVSDVSFAVERGTCFGLLGVNGAGKTTTFKMLTAEILPTFGDTQIDGMKLSKNKTEYLMMAGYCPQTNCFIEQLTGEEMLTIIASMRGVHGRDRKKLVDKWISIIGLDEYKNRQCGNYSGGNKRKLCSAMALIGDSHVVFLDEPTSGVDPVSRRNLYDVMAQSRASGQTVVLTSHSMEECETLCDRLTIMVSGVMKCIGTVQHLKKRYAQGFSALFKIFDTSEAHDKISELKQTIMQVFTPSQITLKDEHISSLYYQITDTSLPWSILFEIMENIKSHHYDIVQDYVITDTTLEEVFISFAKNR